MTHLFVHGLGQDAASWDDVLKQMSLSNVQTVQLKDYIQDENANYAIMSEAFSSTCLANPGKIHLCGLSLGSMLCLDFALAHPEKVASLIVMAPQIKMPQTLMKMQNAIFHLLPQRTFQKMGFTKKETLSLTKSMMDLDFTDQLPKLSCPTLVLCGAKDTENKKASQYLAKHVSNAHFVMVPQAGHALNTEKPQEVAREIQSFYQKLSDSTSCA